MVKNNCGRKKISDKKKNLVTPVFLCVKISYTDFLPGFFKAKVSILVRQVKTLKLMRISIYERKKKRFKKMDLNFFFCQNHCRAEGHSKKT